MKTTIVAVFLGAIGKATLAVMAGLCMAKYLGC